MSKIDVSALAEEVTKQLKVPFGEASIANLNEFRSNPDADLGAIFLYILSESKRYTEEFTVQLLQKIVENLEC